MQKREKENAAMDILGENKKKKMFVKLWSMRFMQIFGGNQCKWVTEGQMVSNGGRQSSR